MVDTKKKQTCIQFRPSYEGFDRKLPLCISFWNLEFAYLPHPFVKYLPSPLKKTVLEHLFEFHFTNSVKGSPQISPMTAIPSHVAHSYNTNQVYKSFPFLLMFLQILSISITQSKRRRKKRKEGKRVRIIAFTISRSHASHLKPYFCQGIQSQYLSDPCCLGRQEQNKGYDYKTFFF